MLYSAHQVLGWSEEHFWASTPRKLRALIKVHVDINTPADKDAPRVGFIDEVF